MRRLTPFESMTPSPRHHAESATDDRHTDDAASQVTGMVSARAEAADEYSAHVDTRSAVLFVLAMLCSIVQLAAMRLAAMSVEFESIAARASCVTWSFRLMWISRAVALLVGVAALLSWRKTIAKAAVSACVFVWLLSFIKV